jgi:hypothetical protein
MRSQPLDVPSKVIIDRIHPQMNEFHHSILNMRMRDEWKRGQKPSAEADFNDLMAFFSPNSAARAVKLFHVDSARWECLYIYPAAILNDAESNGGFFIYGK